MDALILSCGTGGGHNAAAAAVAEALRERGHNADVLNPYELKSAQAAAAVNHAYNALVQRMPSAFGVMYRLGNAYRRLPVSSPIYQANHLIAPLLKAYLSAHPYQAVVTTHLFPAEMLTILRRQGAALPRAYFIATDYACIPFTEETELDWYIIPSSELADDFIGRGVPKEKLRAFGIPVGRAYYAGVSRAEARAQLGIPEAERVILVAGGSVGAGKLSEVVSTLLAHYGDTVRVIVVCGNNQTLYGHLAAAFSGRCELIGYTEKMALYMRACDLFLSKPGGLSSTEAAALGTALIHLSPIPGCETLNMHFFERHGMCRAVTDPARHLIDACEVLLDPEARAQMCACQHRALPAAAAPALCRFMEEQGEKGNVSFF